MEEKAKEFAEAGMKFILNKIIRVRQRGVGAPFAAIFDKMQKISTAIRNANNFFQEMLEILFRILRWRIRGINSFRNTPHLFPVHINKNSLKP